MPRKIITPILLFNLVIQGLLSLATPPIFMFFISWLLVKYLSVGSWIYVVLIIIGALGGFYSMISFILRTSLSIEILEREQKEKYEKDDD